MTMQLGEATIASGASGSEVKTVQQILSGQGYDVGPIDGLFGSQTHKAVQAFQSSHGLVPDGIIGPLTWAALKGQEAPSMVPLPKPVSVSAPMDLGFMQTIGLYVIGGLALLVTLGGTGSKRRGMKRRSVKR